MDAKRKPTGDVLKQIIPPLTAWAVCKILERPRVKLALQKVDRASAERAKRARRKAAMNRVWLAAAGAAALVVGVGLMTRTSRRK
ncbi:MAG: hypothetical protein ACXW2Q_12040 [Thermoanaerobaculia bacterium]